MDLARDYFNDYGFIILNRAGAHSKFVAAGLVGEGSECYGFDDEFSYDHDFGAGFCIWLPQNVFNQIDKKLEKAYNELPAVYKGFQRNDSNLLQGRVGVMSIEAFYGKFLGITRPPVSNMEWLKIPESYLSVATNGEVFYDKCGIFSDFRKELKKFYPEDVLLKKLAARSAYMAQSGQYNYSRSVKRKDYVAAYLACSIFVKNALSVIYLLNGKYMPFYKWAFKGIAGFQHFSSIADKIRKIAIMTESENNGTFKEMLIEEICKDLVHEYNIRGYTDSNEPFMQVQANKLMNKIKDEQIRSLHVMSDAQI